MIWKKRTGPQSFVQYLNLDHAHPIPKKSKKKQKIDHGYDPVIGTQSKADSISLQHQKLSGRQKFFNYDYDDNRNFKYTAKPTPPVPTSYDHLMTDYDRNIRAENAMSNFAGRQKEYRRNTLARAIYPKIAGTLEKRKYRKALAEAAYERTMNKRKGDVFHNLEERSIRTAEARNSNKIAEVYENNTNLIKALRDLRPENEVLFEVLMKGKGRSQKKAREGLQNWKKLTNPKWRLARREAATGGHLEDFDMEGNFPEVSLLVDSSILARDQEEIGIDGGPFYGSNEASVHPKDLMGTRDLDTESLDSSAIQRIKLEQADLEAKEKSMEDIFLQEFEKSITETEKSLVSPGNQPFEPPHSAEPNAPSEEKPRQRTEEKPRYNFRPGTKAQHMQHAAKSSKTRSKLQASAQKREEEHAMAMQRQAEAKAEAKALRALRFDGHEEVKGERKKSGKAKVSKAKPPKPLFFDGKEPVAKPSGATPEEKKLEARISLLEKIRLKAVAEQEANDRINELRAAFQANRAAGGHMGTPTLSEEQSKDLEYK